MNIKIFITGGTIDDIEYSSVEKAPINHQSLIPSLLSTARIAVEYNYEILMQKDSKFIFDEDRELLLQKCRECSEDRILITHGTMTMTETARYLNTPSLSKTIVLTGANTPANKPNSDAFFNLGFAFSSVQSLPYGVYICMNGKVFNSEEVRKNFTTGYFETI